MEHHSVEKQTEEWQVIISLLRETNPVLLNRIGRKMLNYLFKRNVKPAEDLMGHLPASGADAQPGIGASDNEPLPRIDYLQLEQFIEEIFRIAARELRAEEITRMLRLWLRQEQSRFLSMAAERRDIPLATITDAVLRFSMLPSAQKTLSPEEDLGIRAALIRRFMSDDLHYVNTTKDHVTVADFEKILSRTIGPPTGNGKLGGKAAGLFRAEKILAEAKANVIELRNLSVPKTWYLTSDGILDFLHFNALEEMPTIKYRDSLEIRREYPYIEQIFKNSSLSPDVIGGLNLALDDLGSRPIVVRSSSLLEDREGSAFAGKYKSLFVANQGTKRERLEALIDAIEEVYASVFGPDPIEYRRERGLLDFNEEMGILIQEVVGRRVGDYFFPAFAGVALSYNELRWSPRLHREDGIVRLVAGLGTRAVDRLVDDYPFLVSPGQPGLRANVTPRDIAWYSQRSIDVINLEKGRFETLSLEKLLGEVGSNFPLFPQIISLYHDDHIYPSIGTVVNLREGKPVATFNSLIERSPFVSQIRAILRVLQDAIGLPVDIEFASAGDVQTLYLLQCRPQALAGDSLTAKFPQNIAAEDLLFTANRFVTTGQLRNIEYLVYVDPFEYDALETLDQLVSVGRVVGELNAKLPRRQFILMGPGRWGCRGDIKLGVRVNYSDINNTAMLIEIARARKGYVPELSFGTHFFQDLVEAQIRYLPLYPDDQGITFNDTFLKDATNSLRKLVPRAQNLEKVLKVVHIPSAAAGATLAVLMDGDADRAMAFLERASP